MSSELTMSIDQLPIDPWSIGIYYGASPFALKGVTDNPVLSREDVHDVTAAFVADPFLFHHLGLWHLFFEVFNHDLQRGEIGLATSPDAVAWSYRQIVLREAFHLSYPHVFEHEGGIFMTPETLGAGAVRLYRGDPFPVRWEPVMDLIPGVLADPSPFFWNGRWWLFACPRPTQHDALSLFSAQALTGPWLEHPASPVVRGDPRCARPAGRMIVHEGRLYRLAQDCLPRYGSAVRAFEVTSLTAASYAEAECPESPIVTGSGLGWNGKGMHHIDAQPLDSGGWIAVVDGLRLPFLQ
ncbi:MAG: hypothetical protein QOK07_741 [Gemmatimonadaceae bacterium]|nr:hypothetical protein [Gemmatimonadaceae bacterium]